MRDATALVLQRLARTIDALREFALTYADTPTLGFTHFQPAQLTTVGKRATLWLYELLRDFEDCARFHDTLAFRGAKGTTGTQASYLKLFDGDYEKVTQLDTMVAAEMGFDTVFPVCGQTYSRKVDAQIAAILSGIAQSLHKMACDIRLLQNLNEVEEPFGTSQVGSSAMAYKRNPMRCERITSLARYCITAAQSPAFTAAQQWFERTLDDSANKRIAIPELFLAVDAILVLALNVTRGLRVYPKMIARRIEHNLPFMATENILMEAVRRGGDRQQLHEKIREYAQRAADHVKLEGGDNTLIEDIAADPAFGMRTEEIHELLDVKAFTGAAPMQTRTFISQYVDPLLQRAEKFGTPPDDTVRV
jgi:adenylosuccinate lyase